MGKACVEISACASVLVDAHKHIKEFPSGAEDSGEAERTAKHFCQRAINHASMELEGVQAAGLVLGVGSSGSSNQNEYFSGWNMMNMARIVARGVREDVDLSNEQDEETDGFLAAEAEEDKMRQCGGDDDDGDDNDDGGDDGCGVRAAPAEGDFSDSDVVRPLEVAVGGAGARAPGRVDVDLLEFFHREDGDEGGGAAAVYETAGGSKVPITAAHHYAYRDERLWPFSAHEFGRLFWPRKMNAADEKWYATEMEVRGEVRITSLRATAPNTLRLTLSS